MKRKRFCVKIAQYEQNKIYSRKKSLALPIYVRGKHLKYNTAFEILKQHSSTLIILLFLVILQKVLQSSKVFAFCNNILYYLKLLV